MLRKFSFILFLVLWAACSKPDLNDPAVQAAISEAQNLGLAYLEENRLQEAEEAFKQLIELNPISPAGYANLGIVYLRLGNYEGAEKHLTEAYEKDPQDPDIAINLAFVYEQTERLSEARRLMTQAIEENPDHVQSLYTRAQLYKDNQELLPDYAEFLSTVIQYAPANIVPRFLLIESLAQLDRSSETLEQLIQLRQQLPEIPREAQPHFDQAISSLQSINSEEATRHVRVFHNLMKATPYYQTSLRLLGLRTDAAVGTPIISEPTSLGQIAFSEQDMSPDIIDSIELTDATANTGLDIPDHMKVISSVLLDVNGDRETDLFLAAWDPVQKASVLFLFTSQFGRFTNVAGSSNLLGSPLRPSIVLAADYDNDTLVDLFVLNDGPALVFKNQGDGTFEHVHSQAGIDTQNAQAATFADVDHDGDLDLFVGTVDSNLLFRNNLDGSFTEMAGDAGLAGTEGHSTEGHSTQDVDFGDFDDDGDLDLLLSTSEGLSLYTNLRQGVFEKWPTSFSNTNVSASTVGDFNNDGFLDIAASNSENIEFYINQSGSAFSATNPFNTDSSIRYPAIHDLRFFDLDNDGFLDLFLMGRSRHFLHNTRNGGFVDRSSSFFRGEHEVGQKAYYSDYNVDRDLDLFVQTDKGIQLLRNDGGNANRLISIQTRGLVNNNSKNNYFSIGAKVELRAGDLYQTRVVTEPVTYFGLGKRVKADVIRIVFTNGVPQNIFTPGTDQDIIEQQILKGSCPFLYTWTGERFEFATDLLWRSALGMPLGIMAGGETAFAPASLAEDYIMIPEGSLIADSGAYQIKITAELWETPFLDEVKLIVVDTPDSIDIRIDEKFGPPPPSPLPVYSITEKVPVNAERDSGEDLSDILAFADQRFAYPPHTERFQGVMDLHSLILTPRSPMDPKNAVLYLKGWIFPTDASINVAMSQSDQFAASPPQVQVRDASGQWTTVIPNMGFPMGKNKTVRVDLSNQFLSSDQSVRITTNMQLYWDHAFFTEESTVIEQKKTILPPSTANLHYRGFSRQYRTSPFGPHLFDHDSVSTSPRWLDLEGHYTRYGEVVELLQETNDQYVIMNAGDAITISFDAGGVPELPMDWSRRFILYTNGWLKDGDLNTAYGQTVRPLPFRGMKAYPYNLETEAYPLTDENKAYLDTYNTRFVDTKGFRNWLKPETD